MSQFRYRPEIDGLRALSVGAVILFHGGFGCPGGFVGVDVFFVISGFLITSLIVKDLQSDSFTLKDFWLRRIRRIAPPLTVMVIATLLVGSVLLLPLDLENLGYSSLAQALLVSNIYFWKNTGYFATAAETDALLHTWSLAVEEQFYLFFPLFMLLCRRMSRRWLLIVLAVVAALSFALSEIGVRRAPSFTFYMLPTRAWELLAGSLLALLAWTPRRRVLKETMAWTGLGMILAAVLCYGSGTRFPGLAAVPPVLGAVLIILANTGELTTIGRVLAWKPLVVVGLMSYSLYLWHWPVMAYVRYVHNGSVPSHLIMAGAMIVSCVLAALSWRFVEEPVRRRHWFPSWQRLVASFAVSLAGILMLSGAFVTTDGMSFRLPQNWRERDNQPRGEIEAYVAGTPPLLGTETGEPSFIVWGDSHAGAALAAFDDVASEFGLTGLNAARGGRPPIPGVSIDWDHNLEKWSELILEEIQDRNIRHVFLVARWALFVEGPTKCDKDRGWGDRLPLVKCGKMAPDKNSAFQCFQQHLTALVERLVQEGCHVWILPQVPDQPFNVLRETHFTRLGLIDQEKVEGTTRADHERRQSRVNSVFQSLQGPNVTILWPDSRIFDESGRSILQADGVPLYRDYTHLTRYGADYVLRGLLTNAMQVVSQPELGEKHLPEGELTSSAQATHKPDREHRKAPSEIQR